MCARSGRRAVPSAVHAAIATISRSLGLSWRALRPTADSPAGRSCSSRPANASLTAASASSAGDPVTAPTRSIASTTCSGVHPTFSAAFAWN